MSQSDSCALSFETFALIWPFIAVGASIGIVFLAIGKSG